MGTTAFDKLFDETPEPQKKRTAFDALFEADSQAAKQESSRVRALVNGVQHSPDQAAEAVTLSKRMGVPADVALRNLDPLRQMASVEEFDADTFVRENPATSRWLQGDPIRPALAKDDFESLTKMERIFGRGGLPSLDDFGAAFAGAQTAGFRNPVSAPVAQGRYTMQRGTLQAAAGAIPETIELSRLYAGTTAAQRRTPEFIRERDRIKAAIPELPDVGLFENPIERIGRLFLEGFGPSLAYISGSAATRGTAGAIGGGLAGAAGGPASPVTAPVGMGMGATVGATWGAYDAARELSKASAAMTLDEVRDENGQPLPDWVIDTAAETFGIFGGALEIGGYALVGKQIAGAAARMSVTRIGADQMADRAAKKAAANVLARRDMRRVVGEVARTIGTTALIETGEEVAAEFTLIGTEALARIAANMADEDAAFGPVEKVTERLLTTAYETALASLPLGLLGGAGVGIAGMHRIGQAQRDSERITEALGIADASKLRQRDPEAFESVVAEQVRGSGKENLSVDGERLQILLQEQGVPLETFAAEMGLDVKDFASRIAQGGDVMLPTAKVLARLTGTDLITPMADILKWRPDGLAPVEARELAATIEKEGAAIAKELEAEIEIAKGSPEERILADLTARITAAAQGLPKGAQFTPENIEAQALLFTKMYAVAAKRSGQDAWALYQERAPRMLDRTIAEPLYTAMVEARKLEKSGKKPERLAELRATIAQLSGRLPSEQVTKLEQAAFHGTPYTLQGEVRITRADGAIEFHQMGQRLPAEVEAEIQAGTARATDLPGGRFRLDKIGTGEGAQAYGWGLYFAENEGIAEHYRDALSSRNPTLIIDGVEFDSGSMKQVQRSAVLSIAELGYAEALKRADSVLAERTGRGLEDVRTATLRAIVSAIRSQEGRDIRFKDAGALYRVDIPDEAVARMLDWDRPLSEQAPEVREALKAFGIGSEKEAGQMSELELYGALGGFENTLGAGEAKGVKFYKELSAQLGGDKEASLALLAAGIPGIKYLDAGSRTATWSYVFDADFNYWRAKAVGQIGPKFQTEAEAKAWVKEENRKIAEAQTRNLVVFDENLVTITHRNGEPVTAQERTDFLAQEAGTGDAESVLSALRVLRVGDEVSGLTVREGIPNQSSIDASVTNPTILKGVRAVPVAMMDREYVESARKKKLDDRTTKLQREIQESGEINPLIVGVDEQGIYVIEGAHRIDALVNMGVTEIPALVVLEEGAAMPQMLAQSPSLPETLDIDGVARPTRNSTGQPIHPTEEGVRNFYKWFQNSAVVDAEGRPLVVYHGTGRLGGDVDFDTFARGQGMDRAVGWFAENREHAEMYDEGRVIDAYLAFQNPVVLPDTYGLSIKGWLAAMKKAGVNTSKMRVKPWSGFSGDADAKGDETFQFWEIVESQYGENNILDELERQGFDGVVAPEEQSIPGRNYIALLPTQVKDLGNSGEFGPTANILRQGANAFIIPGVSQRTIGLMPSANLSSVIHEMAHDFLFVYRDLAAAPDASPAVKSAYAEMLKAIGAEDGVLTEEAQEKFARGFERYAQDGKAPSRALARAFVRFTAWMTRIYRMMTEKLVPISPELRDVFDRMVATEEELAEVRGEIGAEPMFSDAEAELLGEEAVARYQAKVELRTAEEQGTLLKRLLAERSDEYRKVKAEREKVIRAEVEAEVAERPVYQALRSVTGKDAPKLDLADLEAQFGDGVRATLPKAITASEGNLIPVDAVALQFGFRDGTALVASLQDARVNTEKREVSRIVAERMREEFPDPMESSVVMRDEAQKAAHVGETDDVLLDELKFLGKLAGIRPRGNQQVTLEAVRKVARDTMAKERVRDIRPIVYANAEARAATKSGQAMKKGDYATAEKYKRQQMVQHILYREAVKAVEQVKVIERYARKLEKGASQERIGKAGGPYLDAVNAVLDAYEFRYVTGPRLDRRASLNAFVARSTEENDIIPAIPESVLADAQVVNYRELTMGNLTDVYDTLRQIDHLASLKGKLLKAAKYREIEAAETAIVETIEKYHDIEVRPPDYAPTRFKKLVNAVKKWDAWHVKPEFLFRWLDGEEVFGATHAILFQPIADAQNAEAKMLKSAVPEIKRLFAVIPKDVRKTYDTKLTGPDIPAGYTKEQAVALALNWGNQSNRQAVAEGFLDENKTTPHLTNRQIQALLNTLTKAEWDFVQGVWDYIDSFWPQISDLQKRLVGVAPEKIGADPFMQTTADGETVSLRGGYYPLSYDRDYSWSQRKVEAKQSVQEMADGGFARKVTKHGHTEERVGSGGKPVNLKLSIFPQHIVNVVHDLTHREAVIDVRRMSERPAVRAAIVGSAGKELYDSINPWLNRVAADQTPPSSPMEDLLGRARVGATMVNMGFKVTTAIVQPLGYLQTVDVLGAKYARRGMVDFLKSPKEIWELVKGWSPELESRQTQFDRDVKDAVDKLGVEGWQPEVMQAAFYMTGLLDMAVAVPSFYGAYLKSMETLDPGNHEAAVAYAESVVRQSQSSGAAKDLAMIQGGPESRRMFTMFYSYFSVLYNLFRRSGGMLAQKGVADLPRFAGSMALLWFLPSVISELVAQRGPEDDEDEVLWLLEQIGRYPFASVVGVRDFSGGIASYLTQGRLFYDISPVVSAVEAPIRAIGGALQAVGGEPMSRAELKAAVEAAGYWGKLPSRQMWITGEALYDWMMGYDIEAKDLLFPRPRQ